MSGTEITRVFRQQLSSFSESLGSLVVKTEEQAQAATDMVKDIKAYKSAVHEYWDPICDANHKSWKMSTGRRKEFLDPADAAEKVIKGKIGEYLQAERKRAAEEEAARRKAAEEQAERERIAEVEALRAQGHLDEAEHVASQPLEAVAVAKAEAPKLDGLSGRDKWTAEIDNLEDFLKFCVTNQHFRYLISVNTTELNKLAAAQKEMFAIPGARAVKSLVTAVRS